MLGRRDEPATDAHHIWSGHPRYDLTTNLIALSRPSHDWCHQYPVDGRVTCLMRKWMKGELDSAEFRQASGWELLGWLETRVCSTDGAERRRLDLIEKLGHGTNSVGV
jgi:hypothetical protein